MRGVGKHKEEGRNSPLFRRVENTYVIAFKMERMGSEVLIINPFVLMARYVFQIKCILDSYVEVASERP